ncbi:hypothetical protein KKA85_12390 [bacterium]|nr:hypothetical protein [bacterium]
MRRLSILIAILVVVGGSLPAFSASSDNHTVTVVIPTINDVAITGGNLTLTFVVPTPGSNPADVSDLTTCDLNWSNNEASQKITVATNVASPVATLKVTAGSVSGGTTGGQITLSTTAQDFVTAVTTGNGSCDLEYVASATSGLTAGSEVHTVTYTITSSI